jgi:hypothetical protein
MLAALSTSKCFYPWLDTEGSYVKESHSTVHNNSQLNGTISSKDKQAEKTNLSNKNFKINILAAHEQDTDIIMQF